MLELLVRSHYNNNADDLFERATHFSDLLEVTGAISTYAGLPSVQMEAGRTYCTDIRVFGIFKCSNYQIRINKVCHDLKVMESAESNDMVRLWLHRLQISPTKTGSVWTDHVVIDAGKKTPIISRYAKFMYQHRHKTRGGENIEASLSKACRPITPDRPVFYPAE